MPIVYALHRDGRPTGRVQTVPEPHEVRGPNADRTRRAQAHQRRMIERLDLSAKWQRTTASAGAGVGGADIEALVEQRVAAELARREQQTAKTPQKPARRSRTTPAPAAGPEAGDDTRTSVSG